MSGAAPGAQRCFDLLMPPAAAATAQHDYVALVIDLHAAGASKTAQAEVSGWAQLAMREGFAVVWPDAALRQMGVPAQSPQARLERAWSCVALSRAGQMDWTNLVTTH